MFIQALAQFSKPRREKLGSVQSLETQGQNAAWVREYIWAWVTFPGTYPSEVASFEPDASRQLANDQRSYLPGSRGLALCVCESGAPSFLLSRLSKSGQAMEE